MVRVDPDEDVVPDAEDVGRLCSARRKSKPYELLVILLSTIFSAS